MSERAEQERLWRAAAAGGVGVFDLDLTTGAARCSEHFFLVLGRSPRSDGRLTCAEWESWIDAADRERVRAEVQRAQDDDAHLATEYRVVSEAGELRWVLHRGEVWRAEDGSASRLLGAVHDITLQKHVEAQLRQANDRLSLAQRAGQAGLWDWSMQEQGVPPLVTPEYRDLYGLPEDEPMSYARWLELVHPDDRQRVEAYGREVFAHGTEYCVDFRVEHPSRGLRWMGAVGMLHRDAEGRPERFSGVNLDITPQKLAQRAQRESEERFRKVFENAATGIAITDWQGRFQQCNAAFTTLLGYADPELRHTDLASLIHPDDREVAMGELLRLKSGETPSFETENRCVRRDGETVWLRMFVSVLSDDAGRPTHLLALVSDTTGRHLEEGLLRQSEARLRSVIDSMYAFVAVLAPDGALLEVNRAPVEQVSLRRADLVGRKFWDCPWWSYDPVVQARLERAFERAAGGEVVRYDETIWTVSGLVVIDLMLQPVFDGDQLRFIIPSGVDITDRKRAEQALRDTDRQKDEFLATLAHELRNPLAPLRTGLEVMKLASDPVARERVRAMMERQLGHLVRLVDDLLDVSRISRGKLELRRDRLELGTVIQHAAETSRPLIDAAKHELTVRLPTEPICIEGDLTRLAQVVGNLLNNAAKYTPPGGHISLDVLQESGQAVLRVADDGVGMTPEALPKVFDLFTQASRAIDRAQGGLGIGLSLVRSLVEMQGGTVVAESPGIGGGSTFTVRLPLASAGRVLRTDPSAAVAPKRLTTPAARSAAPLAARRVLVVDDNEDAASMLASVLHLHGNDTRTAHDGPSALTAAREFSPDVVILDLGMPEMSGLEVAQRVRADPALAGTVLVALTGWGGKEDRRRTTEAGFDFHLTKPVDVAAVEEVLARSA